MPRAAKTTKHAYHHGDLRRALLGAAMTILDKEGVHALTLRAVAQRVGVSQAAPYHHFADKEAILAAVAEEGFLGLDQAMTRAREEAGKKPGARLHAIGRSYVRFAVSHPAYFSVMFARPMRDLLPRRAGDDPTCEQPKYPALVTAANKAFETLLETVLEGQKNGAVKRGDPYEIAVLSWSMMHGLAMLWIEGALGSPERPPVSIDALAEHAADVLIRGLAK